MEVRSMHMGSLQSCPDKPERYLSTSSSSRAVSETHNNATTEVLSLSTPYNIRLFKVHQKFNTASSG